MIQPRPKVGASAEASDVDLWALCEAEWSPAQGGFEDERARDWVRSVRADTSDRGVCETCEVRRGGVRGYERELYERVREVRSAVVGVDAGGL